MIEGEKVNIRLVKEKDLKELQPLLETLSFTCDGFLDKLEPEHLFLEKFQKNGFWNEKDGMMVIVDKKNNIIGALFFKKYALYQSLDIKYAIFKEEDRNKGYMKEALPLFSAYLFSTKKINRIQLAIPNYHRASIAIAQKCTFAFEGIARGAAFNKGKYVDLCIYSMLRDECQNIDQLYKKNAG